MFGETFAVFTSSLLIPSLKVYFLTWKYTFLSYLYKSLNFQGKNTNTFTFLLLSPELILYF